MGNYTIKLPVELSVNFSTESLNEILVILAELQEKKKSNIVVEFALNNTNYFENSPNTIKIIVPTTRSIPDINAVPTVSVPNSYVKIGGIVYDNYTVTSYWRTCRPIYDMCKQKPWIAILDELGATGIAWYHKNIIVFGVNIFDRCTIINRATLKHVISESIKHIVVHRKPGKDDAIICIPVDFGIDSFLINAKQYTTNVKSVIVIEKRNAEVAVNHSTEKVDQCHKTEREIQNLIEDKDYIDIQNKTMHQLIKNEKYQMIRTCSDINALKIEAITKAITIHHDDYDFDMGRYHVSLLFPNNNNVRWNLYACIKILALDNPSKNEFPHPHVNTDGTLCTGNVHNLIAKLLDEWKLAELLDLLVDFLGTYSDSEEGRPFSKIKNFDYKHQYVETEDEEEEEESDPCEDCSFYRRQFCIAECSYNSENNFYFCADCEDQRTSICYLRCPLNEGFVNYHPCEDCKENTDETDRKYCYFTCSYNRNIWDLSNPCCVCEAIKNGASCTKEACVYYETREKIRNALGLTEAQWMERKDYCNGQ